MKSIILTLVSLSDLGLLPVPPVALDTTTSPSSRCGRLPMPPNETAPITHSRWSAAMSLLALAIAAGLVAGATAALADRVPADLWERLDRERF